MDEYQTAMLALEKNSLGLQKTSLGLQESSLALQESSLALQQAGLALQEAVLTASHWHTAITLAVSSCLVLYGFRIMRQSTEARNAALQADQEQRRQEHTETMRRMEQQHAETMQHMDREHAETMQRMDREHDETVRRIDRQHTEAMDTLRTIIHGLETTIERTAPKESRIRTDA